jgi:gamma-glutamyltranspeptidase/glutathione hydrolase
MGGDVQPQILLQLLVRTLMLKQSPEEALAAPRWILSSENSNGFDTWDNGFGDVRVLIEGNNTELWETGLVTRGQQVEVLEPLSNRFGHAAMISVLGDTLAGASDPRAVSSGVRGYDDLAS